MTEPTPIFDPSNPCSPLSVPASATALLLCDFHDIFVSSLPPEGAAAATRAANLRTWARSKNMPVIHCLIDFAGPTPSHAKIASTATQMRADVARSTASNPNATAEVAQLTPTADEYTFWRPIGCISVTSSYGLTDFLSRRGIQSVIMAGVATGGCVIDSAKEFTERDLIVSVVEDACADRLPETHEFIVRKILHKQCHVATLDKFVQAWS